MVGEQVLIPVLAGKGYERSLKKSHRAFEDIRHREASSLSSSPSLQHIVYTLAEFPPCRSEFILDLEKWNI